MDDDKSYGEGHEAHYRGYRLKDNPYKRFTEDWEQWKSGWEDEEKDDPYWRKNRNYVQHLRNAKQLLNHINESK